MSDSSTTAPAAAVPPVVIDADTVALAILGVNICTLGELESLIHVGLSCGLTYLTTKGLINSLEAATAGTVLFGWIVWFIKSESGSAIAFLVKLARLLAGIAAKAPVALVLALLVPLALLSPGCALMSGTTTTAQKVAALDADVAQGVQLAAGAEMSNNANSIQYFVLASQALNTLTANGAPSLAQIDAELARVVPAQYQGVVNNAVAVAAQKYQTWYAANQAALDATNTGQYVLGIIQAARDGINAALSNLPAGTLAHAPGVVVSPSGAITVAVPAANP